MIHFKGWRPKLAVREGREGRGGCGLRENDISFRYWEENIKKRLYRTRLSGLYRPPIPTQNANTSGNPQSRKINMIERAELRHGGITEHTWRAWKKSWRLWLYCRSWVSRRYLVTCVMIRDEILHISHIHVLGSEYVRKNTFWGVLSWLQPFKCNLISHIFAYLGPKTIFLGFRIFFEYLYNFRIFSNTWIFQGKNRREIVFDKLLDASC